MSKTINGFEALVEAALLAGCRAVYACRSVPGDEIAGQAAMWMPRVGGAVFHPTTEEAVLGASFGKGSPVSRQQKSRVSSLTPFEPAPAFSIRVPRITFSSGMCPITTKACTAWFWLLTV